MPELIWHEATYPENLYPTMQLLVRNVAYAKIGYLMSTAPGETTACG